MTYGLFSAFIMCFQSFPLFGLCCVNLAMCCVCFDMSKHLYVLLCVSFLHSQCDACSKADSVRLFICTYCNLNRVCLISLLVT